MLRRCETPSGKDYKSYGGKGVKVCERWHDFVNFFADMGKAPDGLSIDRFPDSKGDYEPGNCRWATAQEQNNHRCDNILITWGEKTQTLKEWYRESALGISYQAFWKRYKKGWKVGRLLTQAAP